MSEVQEKEGIVRGEGFDSRYRTEVEFRIAADRIVRIGSPHQPSSFSGAVLDVIDVSVYPDGVIEKPVAQLWLSKSKARAVASAILSVVAEQ